MTTHGKERERLESEYSRHVQPRSRSTWVADCSLDLLAVSQHTTTTDPPALSHPPAPSSSASFASLAAHSPTSRHEVTLNQSPIDPPEEETGIEADIEQRLSERSEGLGDAAESLAGRSMKVGSTSISQSSKCQKI